MKIVDKMRKLALTYPETYEESPWGDRVTKVKGKIFLFCGEKDKGVGLSVKLPQTGKAVLKEKFAEPTGYGLGKAGWVTCMFPAGAKIPEERIAAWIDESYRAVAPKKLVKLLDDKSAAAAAPAAKAPAKRQPAAKAKRSKARVVLLCLDPLRAKRAVDGLDGEGITVETVGEIAAVKKRLAKLDAVIVDLGREPEPSIALVEEIDASDHSIHLFVAGLRDAKTRRRLQASAGSADLFAEPPGDPGVVGAIASAIRSAGGR
jgi:predicted DNA-binding protein (MmcQ/YjbR family)